MMDSLQESIAVTQNYVSSVNLSHVLRFLATCSESLISGCPPQERKTLYTRFLAALEASRPEVHELPFARDISIMIIFNP